MLLIEVPQRYRQDISEAATASLHEPDQAATASLHDRGELRPLRYKRNALIALGVFLIACGLVCVPNLFDRQITRLVNTFADRSQLVDRIYLDFDQFFTFSGVTLVALIWSCWFNTKNSEARARILVATLIPFAAGTLSRSLQHILPTHPRPMYDAVLGFHLPSVIGNKPLNTSNSFPSDHMTVFFGLALAVYIARPKLGIFAIAWILLVESSRTYMGMHYPTDLIAGGSLVSICTWVGMAPRVQSAAHRILRWERSSPSLFYMCGFFLTFQIATLFGELRALAGNF